MIYSEIPKLDIISRISSEENPFWDRNVPLFEASMESA